MCIFVRKKLLTEEITYWNDPQVKYPQVAFTSHNQGHFFAQLSGFLYPINYKLLTRVTISKTLIARKMHTNSFRLICTLAAFSWVLLLYGY